MHAFPSESAGVSSRRLVDRDGRTVVTLATDGAGTVTLHIVPPPAAATTRAWRLRIHLALGQRLESGLIDGAEILAGRLQHVEPSEDCAAAFPFDGAGASPACKAGPVAELHVPAAPGPHRITLAMAPPSQRLG